ncbi:MAG TPA: LamG domain-containing protein, partial [Lacipirellulaceae bacterium]
MRNFVSVRQYRCASAILFITLLAPAAQAGPPTPLESAYWRFEEGPASSEVPANVDVVLDSINDNHMRGFENDDGTIDATPTYVSTVPPTPLKSGLPNTLALDFVRNPGGGGDDLFAANRDINNGIIAPGEGFTVEAAFNSNNPALFAGIVSKEGQPGGSRPLQTFALKTRADNSLLQVEQWDASANLVQVSSQEPIVAGQWYYAAVVNDGSTLSLYLDSNDGLGYQLQGSAAVDGALYQANPANPNWDSNWTIGRGEFGGFPADWFDGIIDEVRLTNSPLAPSEFLFASAVVPLEGDYNNNGKVDAADYVVWRKTGINGQQGYDTWRANFGRMAMPAASGATAAVPEPATVLFCVLAVCVLAASR